MPKPKIPHIDRNRVPLIISRWRQLQYSPILSDRELWHCANWLQNRVVELEEKQRETTWQERVEK